MEYCDGGSLQELVLSGRLRDEPHEKTWSIFRDIVAGLDHIHKNSYIHRDMKPVETAFHTRWQANILLTFDLRAKIGDFGNMVDSRCIVRHTRGVGTPLYMAPEVGAPKPAYDTKADIYRLSCGFCLLGLALESFSLKSSSHSTLMKRMS